ncbi:hypothetical protein PIIN_02681 [Serendipita indica DSM 11827]|uniref:Uncharacterized protein n=1 Tax=Serendipita indica (strain DSM 11827) TaxID=1109443 RepID=G4TBX7_SERID|nr:hypothetical protein PIIN_02681 [Serendipita indica DSM 11827]
MTKAIRGRHPKENFEGVRDGRVLERAPVAGPHCCVRGLHLKGASVPCPRDGQRSLIGHGDLSPRAPFHLAFAGGIQMRICNQTNELTFDPCHDQLSLSFSVSVILVRPFGGSLTIPPPPLCFLVPAISLS